MSKISGVLAAVLVACGISTAGAQTSYPGKSAIRLVVPWTAGSATDAVSRYIGERLSESWKVSVIVDNKPGASGIIGTHNVAQSKPDGHTLLVAVTSHLTNPHFFKDKIPYDTDKDFVPVILLSKTPAILWANPGLGAKSLADVVEMARKDPGKLVYASSGVGNTPHLTAEMFKQAADNLQITHSPYKGAAASVPDVLGGHVPLSISLMGTFQSYYQNKQILALAVASKERMSSAPEIPTFGEQGYPDVLGDEWFGVLAPAGTPPEIVEKLNKEIDRIIAQPETQERLVALGMEAGGGSPQDFQKFMDDAKTRWMGVIEAGNIQAE